MTVKELEKRIINLENKISELESIVYRMRFGKDPRDVNPYDLSQSKLRKNKNLYIHKKPDFKTRKPINF